MFPLDFEEFLYANGMNAFAIDALRKKFEAQESLDEAMHCLLYTSDERLQLLIDGLPHGVLVGDPAFCGEEGILGVGPVSYTHLKLLKEYHCI